jgi:ethanolamine permease
MADDPSIPRSPDWEAFVDRVAEAEIHGRSANLGSEELTHRKDYALKKPLRALDIWALGVGVVITGEYFGWNLGLKDNGPVAMLIAALIVCLLYLAWVLALAELAVGMPFAGGPLAYGRRAFGPSVGFVMGWSMYLECQFATIATALATGGYIAFLVNPGAPSPTVNVVAALITVVLFFALHVLGVQEQSRAMVMMTYAAILGLVLFWVAAATQFSWKLAWPTPLLPESKGWRAVLEAVPYALWFLVMIETVALAAEEAHEPQLSIPRGSVWAQLTLIVLVVGTWLFACGTMDSQELAVNVIVHADGRREEVSLVDYPLAKAFYQIARGRPILVYGFGTIALFGMVASYHGMVYGTSRQAFALGRAGYLPQFFGQLHGERRTPIASLLVCSALTGGFVIANLWFKEAIAVAVLISTLTALIWYILAMLCLFTLRRREPHLFLKYRAPLHNVLPLTVVLLSAFAIYVYGTINVKVIPPTIVLYGLGLGYFWFHSSGRLRTAAPEERVARPMATSGEAPSS